MLRVRTAPGFTPRPVHSSAAWRAHNHDWEQRVKPMLLGVGVRPRIGALYQPRLQIQSSVEHWVDYTRQLRRRLFVASVIVVAMVVTSVAVTL